MHNAHNACHRSHRLKPTAIGVLVSPLKWAEVCYVANQPLLRCLRHCVAACFKRPAWLWVLMMLFFVTPSVMGQEDEPRSDDIRNHPWQVFVRRDIDETGLDRLIFTDMLTGTQVNFDVYGERYTTLRRDVMFYDQLNRKVMLASPNGNLREHPFVNEAGAYRVDWVISDDLNRIAWTVTQINAENALSTVTYVANIDGSQSREVYTDGPRPDIRALPMGFDAEFNTLYMDIAHIDGITNFTHFTLYAGVVSIDLESGTVQALPDEQPANCLCGAELLDDTFLRLRLTPDLISGFDFYVYNLVSQRRDVIPALNLRGYDIGGDILIAPGGQYAVYALAQVQDFGTAQQRNRIWFVLVNLETMTQETLTENAITTFVLPVAWTEDNSAIILTSPLTNGTWKINLNDGRLDRIAEATYIGTLQTV